MVEGLPKLLKEFDETLLKDDYLRILRWGFLTVLCHLSEGVRYSSKHFNTGMLGGGG